jgi:hypothetical protein
MCFTFAYLLANVKLGTHLAAQRKVRCYIWTCFIRKYFRSLHEQPLVQGNTKWGQ